ncbi:Formyltransferase [Dentipellis sp. KUC8613]|nr:Formyltransferase [Dentipellis sp. KUC8613]
MRILSRPSLRWQTLIPRHNGHIRRINSQAPGEPFKILFFGRDEFSCAVFERLHAAQDVWQSICIATHPDERVGRRGSQLSVSPLKSLGESIGVPVHTIPSERPLFRQWKPPIPFNLNSSPPPQNHLLVTASFGRILSSSLLSQFAPGRRLNVHPSLLPSYRGPAPIQHALLNGDTRTGVCVIEMLPFSRSKDATGGIDAGELWAREEVAIPENANFPALRDNLARKGGDLLADTLRRMLAGNVSCTPQPSFPASDLRAHARAITPADALVDFTRMTAETIVRRHRAIAHHKPLTAMLRTTADGASRAVQLLTPSANSDTNAFAEGAAPGMATYKDHTISVCCAEGSVLSVQVLKTEGKREAQAKEWWNGVPEVWKVDREGSKWIMFQSSTT